MADDPPTGLALYDTMQKSIAEVYRIDEVKQIHDKAVALEFYLRQQKDVEGLRRVSEIRQRAERRAGQLLRERTMATGALGNPGGQGAPVVRSHYATAQPETLGELGISKTQSSRWQKLAEIPEPEFQAAFEQPEMPSTNSILASQAKKVEPPRNVVDDDALWLWGRLKDFDRLGVLATDPSGITRTMLPHMVETVLELAPRVAAWLVKVRSL